MRGQPSDTAALALLLDRLMRRIDADLRPKALKVDEAKVGPFGGMVLMTIDENAPISLQNLAKRLSRDKGQITRFVQTLERKDLVARFDVPEDRRVSMLRLTPAGHALVAAFREALEEVVEALLAQIGPQERTAFLRTLEQLLATPPVPGPDQT